MIASARVLRYRVFVLLTYSLGLRLEEALALQVGDIDAEKMQVHIRRGKGHKDRLLPLPDLTLRALRTLWLSHRHAFLLFPNPPKKSQTIKNIKKHMDRGGTQKAVREIISSCKIKKKYRCIAYATVLPHTCLNAA